MWTPDPSKIVTAEQKAAAEEAQAASAGQREALRADAGRASLLDRLTKATPTQIDAYVDANVTTLAQARAMFKTILKLIALDARD
jgi:NADP-dependent 3-hydroxy acid dehydrogenase YdfG